MNPAPLRTLGWAAAAALAALLSAAPRGEACSTGRLLGLRSPFFLLATARSDTVRAGPGLLGYAAEDSAGLASIHGQRFVLDRIGGDVPPELAGAGREAVLVPYGWECRETWRWETARWAPPGRRLFLFGAALRPRDRWAGGLPTFDVELIHDWYPENYVDRYVDSGAVILTPDEVFTLNEALPTFEEAEAAPERAYRRLIRWARANPTLAGRFPATQSLGDAYETLQPCLPAADPHPVAGTYRASIVVGGRDTLTTYLRTDRRGWPECGAPPPMDSAMIRPRVATTSRLYVHGARDTLSIPESNREAWDAPFCRVGTVEVANPPSGEPGTRRWSAELDYAVLAGCFPADARLGAVVDSLEKEYQRGGRTGDPGTFSEGAGGVRLRQAWGVGGRVLLELSADRISDRTLAGYR